MFCVFDAFTYQVLFSPCACGASETSNKKKTLFVAACLRRFRDLKEMTFLDLLACISNENTDFASVGGGVVHQIPNSRELYAPIFHYSRTH